jgi:acyl carrier protein
VYTLLKHILVDQLKVPAVQVGPDATMDDLDLDSLAIVELSVILESDHGIALPEDELRQARTVDDIVALMTRRQPASP